MGIKGRTKKNGQKTPFDALLKKDWIFPVVIVIAIGTIIYAIVSSVVIEKRGDHF